MAGRNQHYIPRFLQKAFGIRPKRKDIWYFSRGETNCGNTRDHASMIVWRPARHQLSGNGGD